MFRNRGGRVPGAVQLYACGGGGGLTGGGYGLPDQHRRGDPTPRAYFQVRLYKHSSLIMKSVKAQKVKLSSHLVCSYEY